MTKTLKLNSEKTNEAFCFNKSIYEVLELLKQNNNRDWYHANKDTIESARGQLETFINLLLPKVREFDSNVGVWKAKDTLYRQPRDIRFSLDKTPYKTHFAANMCYGNVRDHNKPCYYVHLEDNYCMLAGGIAFPMPEYLKKVRDEIFYNFEEFEEIIQKACKTKYFTSLDNDYSLKTAPKGYPKDSKAIPYLKHKNFILSIVIPQSEVLENNFANRAIDIFKSMAPLNKFLFRAIS